MRARPHYFGCSPRSPQPTSTHPPLQTSPPPTCLQHQLIPPPPLSGQGGTTYPSTPF
ncbi:MAG: hypothetical protein ACK55Z_21305 [bacterium]